MEKVEPDAEDVAIRFEEVLEISGIVIGVDGEPCEGATVNVVAGDHRDPRGAARTGAAGTFRIRGPADGLHFLEAFAPDGTKTGESTARAGSRVELRLRRE